jgi:F-type H+-transporting ATPase subunit b
LQEARLERDTMLKEAREMKEKMVADAKMKRKYKDKMIEQAKAAIESEKCSYELKAQVATLSLSIAEKLLKKNYLTKSLKLN